MKVNLKIKEETIEIGDIVSWNGNMALLGILENTSELCLINLKTSDVYSSGVIELEIFIDIEELKLVAKSNKVILQPINQMLGM